MHGFNTSRMVSASMARPDGKRGTGVAGSFENTNASNPKPALIATTAGAGPAILVDRGPLATTVTDYASGGAIVGSALSSAGGGEPPLLDSHKTGPISG